MVILSLWLGQKNKNIGLGCENMSATRGYRGPRFRSYFSPSELAAMRKCQLSVTPLSPEADTFGVHHRRHHGAVGGASHALLSSEATPEAVTAVAAVAAAAEAEKAVEAASPLQPDMRVHPGSPSAGTVIVTPTHSSFPQRQQLSQASFPPSSPLQYYKPLSPCSTFPLRRPSRRQQAPSVSLPTDKGAPAVPTTPATPTAPPRPTISTPTSSPPSVPDFNFPQEKPRHVPALPVVIKDVTCEKYAATIHLLRARIEELEATVDLQAAELEECRSLLQLTDAGSAEDEEITDADDTDTEPGSSSSSSASSSSSSSSPSSSTGNAPSAPTGGPSTPPLVASDLAATPISGLPTSPPSTSGSPTSGSSTTGFRSGKSGVFGRLWRHALVRSDRKNASADWLPSRLAETLLPPPPRPLARSSMMAAVSTTRSSTHASKSSVPSKEVQQLYTPAFAPFREEELPLVAQAFDGISRMAAFVHPLVTDSPDLCMRDQSQQPVPLSPVLTLDQHFPRILSYLGPNSLFSCGLVSRLYLLHSHSVKVVALRAAHLRPRLEPLARCWKIVDGETHVAPEATAMLLTKVQLRGKFVELRRVHKPTATLVDIMMALGALLLPRDLPWKYVKVNPAMSRRLTFGGPKKPGEDIDSDRRRTILHGARWSDCQKIVLMVGIDGHILHIMDRMARFDPDKDMSRKQLAKFRAILRSGVLRDAAAKRGGTLAASVAEWIRKTTLRALAHDKMMLLGKAHRAHYQEALAVIKEAQWHSLVRRKMNDGLFRAFFGWS